MLHRPHLVRIPALTSSAQGEQAIFDHRPALAMLDRGHGLKTTAKAIGVSRTTLRQRLLEAGEWPRPGGVGKAP